MDHVAGPRQLRRLLDGVLTIGSDLDLLTVLQTIIATAVELVDATYGALGVLDESRSRLSDFITVGIDEAGRGVIGHLPDGHGILGLLIVDPKPLRLPDLREHPDRFGFPANHPPMTSFLGVPIAVRGCATRPAGRRSPTSTKSSSSASRSRPASRSRMHGCTPGWPSSRPSRTGSESPATCTTPSSNGCSRSVSACRRRPG